MLSRIFTIAFTIFLIVFAGVNGYLFDKTGIQLYATYALISIFGLMCVALAFLVELDDGTFGESWDD